MPFPKDSFLTTSLVDPLNKYYFVLSFISQKYCTASLFYNFSYGKEVKRHFRNVFG